MNDDLPAGDIVWTDKRVEEMRSLWRKGWSAGQIAREFSQYGK